MIRKKIMNKLALALFLLCGGISIYGQCNYQLVEEAAQLAGSNTVYLRDFKVRLENASIDDPVPTGKFPVYLNKGVHYRFTTANSADADGKAYVELIRRGQVYASNHEEEYAHSFDYTCERSATYQLQINFGEGGEGCAAIVMSLILQDSLTFIEPGVALESDSLETMFLWARNEVQIATTLGSDYTLEVILSQGTYTKEGKAYVIRPKEVGSLDVFVNTYNREGEFVEGDTVTYIVEIPPLPLLTLPNERAGVISLRDIYSRNNVGLEYYVEVDDGTYELVKFTVAKSEISMSELTSYDTQLTLQQVDFIRELKPGDSFYLTNIQFRDVDGKIRTAQNRKIYIID